MNSLTFHASDSAEGMRIDKWLYLQDTGLTRSALQKLIETKNVFVNDAPISKNYKCRNGDNIALEIPDPVDTDAKPENIPIDIVYEDDSLLVVNKPKGMVVHPAPGNYSGTLVNALLYHCDGRLSGINGVIRPGIVHRIDKNTSGLLIVAKTDAAHSGLAEQIKNHSFTREYEAVALGRFKELSGTINAPIGRNPNDRKKMCVTYKNSKDAVTHYEVIEQYEKCAHLRLRLETGRTHQIRVHLSYKGHPVLGDEVYGKIYSGIDGQCLHAKKIGFIHPIKSEYMEFDSVLPDYFKEILRKVR